MMKTISILAIAGLVLALVPAAQAADYPPTAYRIIFSTLGTYTAEATDIAVYNARVEAVAAGTSGDPIDLSGITGWKMIGATATTGARANTGTDTTGGANDVPIYNVLGEMVAAGNAELWNAANVDLLAVIVNEDGSTSGERVWTGMGNADGTTHATSPLGADTVAQADRRTTDEQWASWWGTGNPNPNTMEYKHYGLSPVIPEPATMSLLAIGGIALIRRRRRA